MIVLLDESNEDRGHSGQTLFNNLPCKIKKNCN